MDINGCFIETFFKMNWIWHSVATSSGVMLVHLIKPEFLSTLNFVEAHLTRCEKYSPKILTHMMASSSCCSFYLGLYILNYLFSHPKDALLDWDLRTLKAIWAQLFQHALMTCNPAEVALSGWVHCCYEMDMVSSTLVFLASQTSHTDTTKWCRCCVFGIMLVLVTKMGFCTVFMDH